MKNNLKLLILTRWEQLLKASVRVFFVQYNGTKNVSRTVFNIIFLILATIYRFKSLELTKNYHKKLIAPNGLILLLISCNAFSQYDGKKYNQFSIEASYNISVPYTATNFKELDNGNYTSFNGYNFGLRYMFNENLGLKGAVAFNNYTGENNLGTEFTRLDAQAFYNLGKFIRLPYATNDKIGLLLHSGFGLSKSKSLSKNATENIWNYLIGISPIFSLSDRFSLATDVTYVANFKQQFNYDGELFSDEKDTYKYGYNLNYSIGLIFYIGHKGRAADWY